MGLRSFFAGSLLVQRLTPVAGPHELFPGVEKPSVTLAKMLCAEMLQHINIKGTSTPGSNRGFVHHEYNFPSIRLRVMESVSRERTDALGYHDVKCYSLTGLTLQNNAVTFDEAEKAVLLNGWKKFWELHSTYESNKKEEERQHKALSCIETFFKTKEVPCVPLEPVKQPKIESPAPPSPLDSLLSPVS